jgi:alpha-glucosidase (family GH31 glycosyl hydrolase)
VARGYVSRGLPISTIVIDWKHWVNIGDWTFNPACWPDPQVRARTLTRRADHRSAATRGSATA